MFFTNLWMERQEENRLVLVGSERKYWSGIHNTLFNWLTNNVHG